MGASNAGKSTLLNRLVGSKVSIVTPKVQTTRTRVTGILVEGNTQLVFIDTPGVFAPKKALDKAMVDAAWDGMASADITVLLVDAKKGMCADVEKILQAMQSRKGNYVLALNKVDTVKKDVLLALAAQLNARQDFQATFMLSALTGDGVVDFRQYLAKQAPKGEWPYPEDQLSDMPLRLMAAEITREKLMLYLQKELPYQLKVETESWEEEKGKVTIRQVITVANEGHKKIVIGKQAQMIKKVGEQARKELEKLLEMNVNLFTFVKVRENWLEEGL